MDKRLRNGYTTGACAAAAAKAAAAALIKQKAIDIIEIELPQGEKAVFFPKQLVFSTNNASCYVIKDAGDDPDITDGIQIYAHISKTSESNVRIKGGKGVGKVTKPGLPVPVGHSAINPVPLKMIKKEVLEVIGQQQLGIEVIISIPKGEELAQKTLNSHLGIEGGLSILGTTGIVKPMSEEAYKQSLVPQLKVIKALGYDTVVFTPGNIGMHSAENYGIPKELICQTSNFIGFMLENCQLIGFKKVVLWGHPGKLLKVACGNFHTHNRMSDGRMETLMAHLALLNAPKSLLNELFKCTTTDRAMELIAQHGYQDVWNRICQRISQRAEAFVYNKIKVGTVLLKGRNQILSFDDNAMKIREELNWPIFI